MLKKLLELPKLSKKDFISPYDFEKLSEEYDVIEVLISEDHRLYHMFYGWDCDSIVIMNPNIIILEDEED